MAPATASGGPVSVIRISGRNLSFVEKVTGSLPAPGTFAVRQIKDPKSMRTEVVDNSLVLFFKAPHSFTGEDVVEIQCHGVPSVVEKICELLRDSGARTALPGEFSFRAVLNEKMTLEEAESLQSALSVEGLQVELAAHLLSGQSGTNSVEQFLSESIKKIQSTRGRVEAAIDFPEAEAEQSSDLQGALTAIEATQHALSRLLSAFENFCSVAGEPKIALIGETNVGKSTLFNLLCGGSRAIVSKIPGTTRDVLEARVRLPSGRWVRLLDTAGLRDLGAPSNDHENLEILGMRLGIDASERARLVIRVDKAFMRKGERVRSPHDPHSKNSLSIYSHADELGAPPAEDSFDFLNDPRRATNWLLSEIETALESQEMRPKNSDEKMAELLISSRQEKLIHAAFEEMDSAKKAVLGKIPIELAAEHLGAAEILLKKAIGRDVGDEYIGEIFSQFCLGK